MEEMEAKARLVREVCTTASTFSSCTHGRRSPRLPAFVDWYLILRVDEDAAVEAIRKRYRQLGDTLQLHPDKNRHPKAEVAFRLVSEAYACLSDKVRRKAFDAERRNNYCKECYRKLQPSTVPINRIEVERDLKSRRVLEALKEVQNRLREECRVIERYLRSNRGSRKESPPFDPSDRQLFPDYPHGRARVFERQRDSWYFNSSAPQSPARREVPWESPVYQIRTETRASRARTPAF